VRVNWPLTFVLPLVGEGVPPPLDEIEMANPVTRFENASRTVQVGCVATPVPTRAEKPVLLAMTDDGAAALTVTPAVDVSVPDPVTAAEIVFPCATVELNVRDATPLAVVVSTADAENVLPVPVDENVTILAGITLLN